MRVGQWIAPMPVLEKGETEEPHMITGRQDVCQLADGLREVMAASPERVYDITRQAEPRDLNPFWDEKHNTLTVGCFCR
jgi:hypothetical protein